MPRSVQNKMITGAVWMIGMMIVDRLIGFVSTVILARILLPEDFGIVAMCSSVVGALAIFSAFSLDMVLIQRPVLNRDHYDTAWTLGILFGSLVSILIAASAIPSSMFYDEERLVIPLLLLAGSFFLRSLANVKVVDFRKEMQFRKETTLRVSQKLVGFCITVPLAFYLESYWAMVIGMIGINVSYVIVSYIMVPYKPRFTLSERKTILGFSSWLFLMNMVNFVRLRVSDFVIGRQSGAHGLGLFEISRDVASKPTTMIVASMNRAFYPGYSKLSENMDILATTFLTTMGSIAIIIAPLGVGIASITELLVPILLGDKWLDTIPIMKVMAVFGLLAAQTSNVFYIFNALDTPRTGAYINVFQALLMVPLVLYLTTMWGTIGAAWALVISASISLPVGLVIVSRMLDIRIQQYLKYLYRPVLSATVMYFSVQWIIKSGAESMSEFSMLVVAIVIGAFAYISSIVTLAYFLADKESPELQLFGKIVSKVTTMRTA